MMSYAFMKLRLLPAPGDQYLRKNCASGLYLYLCVNYSNLRQQETPKIGNIITSWFVLNFLFQRN